MNHLSMGLRGREEAMYRKELSNMYRPSENVDTSCNRNHLNNGL